MAGDWIKVRTDLQSHPKIVRILSATSTDKFRVIGGLHAVWSVFDTHSSDGTLKGYTPDLLDHVIGWQGFSRAMESVGWLLFDGLETLTLPEFDAHNGQSAKRRAEDQKRKRDARKCPQSVRNLSAGGADETRTRDREEIEKKKEEKRVPPRKAKDGRLPEWIAALDGADAVPADDPLFAWAETAGIPRHWIALAWWAFEARYESGDKTYSDWRAVFRRAVREDWLKLWRNGRDGWELTTAGESVRREMEAAS